MDKKLTGYLKEALTKFDGKVLTDDLFQEIEKRVYSLISTFEENHNVTIEGIAIKQQLNGNVAVSWDAII